jgi:hypothetical protein
MFARTARGTATAHITTKTVVAVIIKLRLILLFLILDLKNPLESFYTQKAMVSP